MPQTFGGEAAFETQNDAMNDDTFGEEAEDEVTFGARPPASGGWGSHAISALAEAFEDERERREGQDGTDEGEGEGEGEDNARGVATRHVEEDAHELL